MPDDTDERILGTDVDDIIDAQGGSDTVFGDAGDDTLSGGEGRDIIRGGSGNDTIRGNADGDILLGDSGDDTIYGGEGNDLIVGGTGNDTLVGGLGDDSLTGGTGEDTFLFKANTGHDTIQNFDKDNDTIDLSVLPEAISVSDLTFTALTDGRTGTVITHSALTGSITVLTADMFNLRNGSTTSVTTTEGDTVQVYENPWEGTEESDILIDQSNSTHIVARLLRFPGYSQTRQKAKDRFAWAGFRFQEQREGHDRRTRPRCTRY